MVRNRTLLQSFHTNTLNALIVLKRHTHTQPPPMAVHSSNSLTLWSIPERLGAQGFEFLSYQRLREQAATPTHSLVGLDLLQAWKCLQRPALLEGHRRQCVLATVQPSGGNHLQPYLQGSRSHWQLDSIFKGTFMWRLRVLFGSSFCLQRFSKIKYEKSKRRYENYAGKSRS